MELKLEYRENSYLNDKDIFFCYDKTLKKLFLSKLHFDKGFWWTNESLKYKVTTIVTQKANGFLNNTIKYKGIDYEGTVTKFLTPNDIGIVWAQGKQIKQYGMANFWTELNKLEISYLF